MHPRFTPDDVGMALLDALLAAPLAWSSPAELARATHLELELVIDLLAALDDGGWIEGWDRGADVVVTLSVWAAREMGVRIVEVGASELPRWARADQPDPPSPRARGAGGSPWLEARLARLVDPGPSPQEVAEEREFLSFHSLAVARDRELERQAVQREKEDRPPPSKPMARIVAFKAEQAHQQRKQTRRERRKARFGPGRREVA